MFYFHKKNCFGYTLGLIPINRVRTTSGYGTKTTTACACISKYHKGGGASSPTLTHIWAIATLTNCMKTMCIYKIADMFIIFPDRKFDTEPVGFFGFTFFVFYICC